MRWRWDQGRLDYFRFSNIRKIAKALVSLDGESLQGDDSLRETLERETGLPYLPRTYSVWRNYGRTFQCSLLASKINNRLRVTDVCHALAVDGSSELSPDDYFPLLMRRFYLPFPAFQNWSSSHERIFPFCAVTRFLLSKAKQGIEASATTEDIFSYVVGNSCKGDEPLSYYEDLQPTDRRPLGDELRQVREMLVMISQCSFLKWNNHKIWLDVETTEGDAISYLADQIIPDGGRVLSDRSNELLRLGRIAERFPTVNIPQRETPLDTVFTEGRRVARYHLRIERNRSLRREFFRRLRPPYHCDVCRDRVNSHYPWIDNLLHVHHVLPLSSPVRTTVSGTTFSDLVPVCPNCHNAIHSYYRQWLTSHNQEDFASDEQAQTVYQEIKTNYRS